MASSFRSSGGYSITTPFTFHVVAGTLKAGSSLLAQMINFGVQPTTVDAGATFDLGGFGLSLTNLLGGGAVTDSGAAATFDPRRGEFLRRHLGPAVACRQRRGCPHRRQHLHGNDHDQFGRQCPGWRRRGDRFDRRRRCQRRRRALHRPQQRSHARQRHFRRRRSETDRDRRHLDQYRQHLYRRHDRFGRNARHRQRRCAWNRDGVNDRRRTHRDGDRDFSRTRSVFREARPSRPQMERLSP